jgi:hypothetical protein
MKTERLIEMLSTNIEPVNPQELRTSMAWALVLGGAAAFCLMLSTVSLRVDLGARSSLWFVALKLLFALTVVGTGLAFLGRAVRPGQDARTPFQLAFLPFIAVGVAAVIELAFGLSTVPHPMTTGTHWVMCLYCIPLFAAIPFVLLVWALRLGAPTNLRRTGAMAGLVAGAVGAAAYAFHCPDDSLPFIALWYGASIAVCAAVGATLGPRVLRW